MLIRLAAVWAPNDKLNVTPSFYYQDRYRNDVESYWPLYSEPEQQSIRQRGSDAALGPGHVLSAGAEDRRRPGLREADLEYLVLSSQGRNGYDGTLYNLGFYQSEVFEAWIRPALPRTLPLLDGNGVHLPAGATNYRSPASIDNGQQNITQEIRLQSNDPNVARSSGPRVCSSARIARAIWSRFTIRC